eukprot:scaffold69_cov248-Pinguiococcus_pyrenoidosus.AAC.81
MPGRRSRRRPSRTSAPSPGWSADPCASARRSAGTSYQASRGGWRWDWSPSPRDSSRLPTEEAPPHACSRAQRRRICSKKASDSEAPNDGGGGGGGSGGGGGG